MSVGGARPSLVDLEITERLVAGLPLDELPADRTAPFADVARLLAALGAPATAEERAGATAAAAEYVAARVPRARRTPVRRPLVQQRRPRLVAAAFSSFLALSGTAFATSVGALPKPVERIAHNAFAVVGLHLGRVDAPPAEGDHASTTGGQGEKAAQGGQVGQAGQGGKAGKGGKGGQAGPAGTAGPSAQGAH